MSFKKYENIEIDVVDYAFEGKGIGFIKDETIPDERGLVVFVNGGYPGDRVSAKIMKIKSGYLETKVENIIIPSQFRRQQRCKFFGTCGGCKQQDLDYDVQVSHKEKQTAEVFEKIGGIKNIITEHAVKCENEFYYRNKMEFSFAPKRWLSKEEIGLETIENFNFGLGFHVPGVYDKVINIDECYLQSEVSVKILNFSREYFINENIKPYVPKSGEGWLRNLVIREAAFTPGLMVNLVTSRKDSAVMEKYSTELIRHFPEITTIVNNINSKFASVAFGENQEVYFGEGYIYDKIGDYEFRISPNSFFQTNTKQAQNLYNLAKEFCGLTGNEVVYDLYCGAGTITLFLSNKCKQIYGFETVASSIADAVVNAELNNVSNAGFFEADLYKSFLPVVEENKLPAPDVILLDPPRAGMHSNTVSDVIKLNPPKIIYVSCNPATQARDVKLLCEAGYQAIKMCPVDMFPQTYHIENVVLLER